MELRRNLLWVLVALFVVVSVASVLTDNVLITALYVAILVAFALIHASLRYGPEGTAAFAVICLVVSNSFENLSVVTGFPFGHYHYTDALGPKLFHVPLLIGPTYMGVGYLSWVLATVLVGDVARGADRLCAFATPFIAAFIMVLWDLSLDPGVSTTGKWWIWEESGGFFGVPLSNYLGWFFTVYVFMQLFALYLATRGPDPAPPQPRPYFAQATIMYAVVALIFVLNYLVKGSEPVVDATGVVWRSGDIAETAAITSIFTMLFVVALAAITIARAPAIADPRAFSPVTAMHTRTIVVLRCASNASCRRVPPRQNRSIALQFLGLRCASCFPSRGAPLFLFPNSAKDRAWFGAGPTEEDLCSSDTDLPLPQRHWLWQLPFRAPPVRYRRRRQPHSTWMPAISSRSTAGGSTVTISGVAIGAAGTTTVAVITDGTAAATTRQRPPAPRASDGAGFAA